MASKLQELLAAKKQQEVVNAKPVLQSQAVKEITQEEQAPQQQKKKPSILDKFKKRIEPAPITNGAAGNPTSVMEPGLVSNVPPEAPTMPAGLSKLQQIQWKKANATVQNVGSTTSTFDKKDISAQKTQVSSPEQATVSEPVRELSASQSADALKQNDGTADIAELKSNLVYLSANIENGPVVKDVVRTIAMQVAQHPEICKYMTRGEVNTMVRGLRSAYQVAAMNKKEKAETKKKGDAGVDEIAQAFKDMGVNFKFT